jgi:hypothetical protein
LPLSPHTSDAITIRPTLSPYVRRYHHTSDATGPDVGVSSDESRGSGAFRSSSRSPSPRENPLLSLSSFAASAGESRTVTSSGLPPATCGLPDMCTASHAQGGSV